MFDVFASQEKSSGLMFLVCKRKVNV